jgi:GH15 family glucan-1,4-alpha-glucosidase
LQRNSVGLSLLENDVDFIKGQCLENLLHARVRDDGWFIAAPGYVPYGNYVWLRDNAECIACLDEFSATFGETRLFEITAKALARAFRYLESKEKGVRALSTLQTKLANPEFYKDAYHPNARLSAGGDELNAPWNNLQYDSVARTLIALARHLSYTKDKELFEKCRAGVIVGIRYLFDAIWDHSGSKPLLTVCANEWEEKDEPYLKSPLFSSVVGLIHAASKQCASFEDLGRVTDIDLKEYETQTGSMLTGFFLQNSEVRMIKRFQEPPAGTCSTSLWLLTTYEVFPVGSDVYSKTFESLRSNANLSIAMSLEGKKERKVRALRRYEVPNGYDPSGPPMHVDRYWGGQAWLITTAQAATVLARRGEVEEASDALELCVRTRNSEGELPEQFEGTFIDRVAHQKWKDWSGTSSPAPWLSWSHAEVLRAYSAIHNAN